MKSSPTTLLALVVIPAILLFAEDCVQCQTPATQPASTTQPEPLPTLLPGPAPVGQSEAAPTVQAAPAPPPAPPPAKKPLPFDVSAARHWIVFDADAIGAKPRICDSSANCHDFSFETDYFTTGSLIYIAITHAKLCATYSIVTNGVQIAEDRPAFNGVTQAKAEKAGPCKQEGTVFLFLGQYTTNYIGTFSVCESMPPQPHDTDSGDAPGTPCAGTNPTKTPSPTKTSCPPINTQCQCPCTCPCANTNPSSPGSPAKTPSSGTLVGRGNFEVHKLYRGNIVAGFFVSKLVNRQYGITNNGQSTSSTNVTYVTVTGPTTRPQYHAFVGINIYPWRRDVFPGAMGHQGFLSEKEGNPKVLNGYWNPGIVVGYGVDATNNYLLGLNWETAWGINIGSGVHVGQEAYLQPGIVPGVTQLPSNATSAPTVNETKYGWYGSIGFDLNTMKSALSQLFGGGSKVGSN